MSETGGIPSRKGYWFGAAIVVLGVLGAVVWVGLTFLRFSDTVDDFQRFPLNEEGVVTFAGTGGYVIYYEGPGASDGNVPEGQVQITPVDGGDPLDLAAYDTDLTYDFDRSGVAVLTVEVDEPGDYLLVSQSEGDGHLAVGRSVASRLVFGLVGGFAVGGLGVVVGAIVLIVTAVRRRGPRPTHAPWIPPPPPPTGP